MSALPIYRRDDLVAAVFRAVDAALDDPIEAAYERRDGAAALALVGLDREAIAEAVVDELAARGELRA